MATLRQTCLEPLLGVEVHQEARDARSNIGVGCEPIGRVQLVARLAEPATGLAAVGVSQTGRSWTISPSRIGQ